MKKQILLVDDEPQNLDILRIFLNSLNYELFEVNCGTDALLAIKQNDAFDLILLDVMMPDISGLEICRTLNKSGFDIPIIFLSAMAQKEDVLVGLQAGAFDYLTKPYDLDLLEKKIAIALEQKSKHSELQRTNAMLSKIAFKDGLTNLYNRSYLNKIKVDIEGGIVHFDSIMLIDVDNFKEINDQFGHLWGDKVLSQLSEIIVNSLDVEENLVFRYGGDEFLVILQNSDLEYSKKVADLIHDNITSSSFGIDTPTNIDVTVCIGLANRTKDEPFDTLFIQADQSLFEAKQRGRNKIILAE